MPHIKEEKDSRTQIQSPPFANIFLFIVAQNRRTVKQLQAAHAKITKKRSKKAKPLKTALGHSDTPTSLGTLQAVRRAAASRRILSQERRGDLRQANTPPRPQTPQGRNLRLTDASRKGIIKRGDTYKLQNKSMRLLVGVSWRIILGLWQGRKIFRDMELREVQNTSMCMKILPPVILVF